VSSVPNSLNDDHPKRKCDRMVWGNGDNKISQCNVQAHLKVKKGRKGRVAKEEIFAPIRQFDEPLTWGESSMFLKGEKKLGAPAKPRAKKVKRKGKPLKEPKREGGGCFREILPSVTYLARRNPRDQPGQEPEGKTPM